MENLILIKDGLRKAVRRKERSYRVLAAENFLEIRHG